MRTQSINGHLRVIIDPGEYYSSNVPVTISTLLGSCVAACLFDPVNKVMGMNHFMLSQQCLLPDLAINLTEAGRYGIHAMELLINQMLKNGAKKMFLKAKVFGGSSLIGNGYDNAVFLGVGAVNIRFIHEFLRRENIPLTAENVGGKEGRVIHFSFGDFSVYMRKLKSIDKSKRIAIRDRDFWENVIIERQNRENTMDNVQLW